MTSPWKIGISERKRTNARTMTKIEVFLYFYIHLQVMTNDVYLSLKKKMKLPTE